MPTPPFFPPTNVTVPEAWVFFLMLVAWTGLSLYGLTLSLPLYARWTAALEQAVRRGFDEERIVRAKMLRRQMAIKTVVLAFFAAGGLIRYGVAPGFMASVSIAGALLAGAALLVANLRLDGFDLTRIENVRSAQKSRVGDRKEE